VRNSKPYRRVECPLVDTRLPAGNDFVDFVFQWTVIFWKSSVWKFLILPVRAIRDKDEFDPPRWKGIRAGSCIFDILFFLS